jgi:ketosteroid isomerase-like protein
LGGSRRSSRAVFSRLWEAYGQGRLDDALHLIDPDCVLRVSVTDRVYRGHDGVRSGMVDFRQAWKSATLTSDEVIEINAETIVVVGHVTAFDHSGARLYDEPLVWMAVFSNGRLLDVTSYSTRAEALAAAAEPRPDAD